MVNATGRWASAISVGLSLFLYLGASQANAGSPLDQWIEDESKVSSQHLLNSISPSDGAPGAVIASPSRERPNYYFHWVRDAGIVMDAIVTQYENASTDALRKVYRKKIEEFIVFSRKNQLTANRSANRFGEPKFNVDGSAFDGDWGRPQNDGPALRAIALMHFARILIDQGERDWVKQNLYRTELPATTVIKADLEFLSHHWHEASFDPWEESLGQHFYVHAVQRKALADGAKLAELLDDPGAASWYLRQAVLIEETMNWHWSPSRNYLLCTIDRSGGIDYKGTGLDSSVILGVNQGHLSGFVFAASDDRVSATVAKLQQAFRGIYPINDRETVEYTAAIGRYPEDRYDGYEVSGTGNPWVLATLGFAEYYYRLASEWKKSGVVMINATNYDFFNTLFPSSGITRFSRLGVSREDPKFWVIVNRVLLEADRYMGRVKRHQLANGSLSEQINRNSGYMQGAEDLTWNYAAFLTAAASRKEALR